MKKSALALSVSLGVISVMGLTGCGGGGNDSSATGAVTVKSMTVPVAGFQTLQDRSHSVASRAMSANSAVLPDDQASRYVYRNATTNEVGSVHFTGEEASTDDVVTMPTLMIERIVDINPNFSAINFDQVSVAYGDATATGKYTLILDKRTGTLYSLLENGKPTYVDMQAEKEVWYTHTSHTAMAADPERIYLKPKHGSPYQLLTAEVEGDAMVLRGITLEGDSGYSMANSHGDILALRDDIGTGGSIINPRLVWVDKTTQQQSVLPLEGGEWAFTTLFEHQDTFFIKQINHGKTFVVTLVDGNVTLTESAWKDTAGTEFMPDINGWAVKRDNYTMNSYCQVTAFNNEAKEFEEVVKEHRVDHAFSVMAGENALFCINSAYAGNDPEAHPQIFRFDTETKQFDSPVTADAGTTLDATERFVVVSDHEVMFYSMRDENGQFTEYYLNLENGEQTQKKTDQLSVMMLQTYPEKG
ncbi:hypothetical protein L4C36_05540 [Photobacterium japonica]|uniref:hypothetical protein n=1 Tax=Photobacterium japonica TaxID=2910235 RepID=UPI003D119D56